MVDFTGGTWRSLIDGSKVGAIPDAVETNLNVWYPANEGSGNPTDALTGNTITLNGTTWTSATTIWDGNALDHDGTDDESIEDQTVDITGGVSICGWFYPRDLSTALNPIGVVDSPSSPTDTIRLQQFDGDRIRIAVNNGSSDFSGSNPVTGLSNNEWYFIAGTAQSDGAGASDLAVYVWDTTAQLGTNTTGSNNEADYSTLNSDKFAASSRDEDGRFFDGVIDAVGYNAGSVLSETQFEAIWNDTKP